MPTLPVPRITVAGELKIPVPVTNNKLLLQDREIEGLTNDSVDDKSNYRPVA